MRVRNSVKGWEWEVKTDKWHGYKGIYPSPHPQAFIFLGKDPGLEILQQEGGTLAHWLGHQSCCGVWGRLGVLGEQELGWSS